MYKLKEKEKEGERQRGREKRGGKRGKEKVHLFSYPSQDQSKHELYGQRKGNNQIICEYCNKRRETLALRRLQCEPGEKYVQLELRQLQSEKGSSEKYAYTTEDCPDEDGQKQEQLGTRACSRMQDCCWKSRFIRDTSCWHQKSASVSSY